MPRRPVNEQALRGPIHITEHLWYYEEAKGITICVETPGQGVEQYCIPYRRLAETICRAWGVVLKAKARG